MVTTTDLALVLDTEGEHAEIGGNRPFALDDPESVWFVRAAQVDVFAEETATDGTGGARRHLFRVATGGALLGVGRAPGVRLLAVAGSGTHLTRLPRRRLCELAADPAYRPAVSQLVEGWVEAMSQGLGKPLAPKAFVPLAAGAMCRLEAGACARPARALVWVQHAGGSSQILGRSDLPSINGALHFPVAAGAWLAAVSAGDVSCHDTPCWLAEDRPWAGLDHFHAVVLDGVARDSALEQEARRRRLDARAAHDRAGVAGALGSLAAVLDATPPAALTAAHDPLLAVCRLVGAALEAGIHEPPPVSATGQARHDPVEGITRASRLRKRRVALRGPWWRQDNGPLVAFLADDKRPVALLPTSPTSYELHDVVAGTRTLVTPPQAARLEPFAYRFYRTLPSRLLRGGDLLRFAARGSAPDLVRLVLVVLLGALLGTVVPLATGLLFEHVIPRADRGQLLQVGLGLVVAAFAAVAVQLVRGLALLRLGNRAQGELEAAIWDRVLNLPSRFFRDYPAGDLAVRAMGVSAIRQALTANVLTSLMAGLMALGNLAVLFLYSGTLALVACGLLLVAVAIAAGLGYLQVRQEGARVSWQGRVSGLLLQLLGGIAKLRVAGAEGRAFARWAEAFTHQRRAALKARRGSDVLSTFNAAFLGFAAMALYAAVVWTYPGGFSPGNFLGFAAAFGGLLGAALGLCSAAVSVLGIVPLFERMRPILLTQPEVDEARESPGALAGDIEVSHVCFRYAADGPLILNDLSLHVAPGEFVALVGPSGCGKSTLLRLLLGFEAPESGTVAYDGKDLAALDVREVRRQIGVVLQSGRLLPGSIQENILGSFDLGLEDAWEAARLAGLAADIEAMPMKMQTMITEGASTLSGGQRQRLLIARAVVNRPRILFFDEATSALDNATQAVVSRSLERLKCTRVVIAHRLSTVAHADRILVLERGHVVQAGTYQELMAQPGPFADLARRQLV
jgi:NHLM bacteriocin system ABC transporter ATP-binding protein